MNRDSGTKEHDDDDDDQQVKRSREETKEEEEEEENTLDITFTSNCLDQSMDCSSDDLSTSSDLKIDSDISIT